MDVIEGRGPSPFFVMALVQRLPDDSLTAALVAGGREHFGWGVNRHMLADLFDSLGQNTRATGNWGKGKAPKMPVWPRPVRGKKDKKKAVNMAEFYERFNRR